MDQYLLAIVALIIFSILAILYVRIFVRNNPSDNSLSYNLKSESEEGKLGSDAGVLSHIKPDDFTLLE